MALVLALTTRDRGDPVPLLPRRGFDQSWQGGRDCLARYSTSEVKSSRLWMGWWEVEIDASRSLRRSRVGEIVDQAVRAGHEGQTRLECEGWAQHGEMRHGRNGVCIRIALCIPHVCGHLYSILCQPTFLVPILLYFFSNRLQVFVACQTEGASSVEVLLAFRPTLGPPFCALSYTSISSLRLSQPWEE